jgi:hypothetical protein
VRLAIVMLSGFLAPKRCTHSSIISRCPDKEQLGFAEILQRVGRQVGLPPPPC